MSKVREPLAFWLVPAPPEREIFAQIIDQLAGRFHAPRFEPHLTLLSAKLERERAGAALQ
ncbi:MAG: hypothetical protein ACR2HH_03910 [Chthoniobacterales bacterium]